MYYLQIEVTESFSQHLIMQKKVLYNIFNKYTLKY